jgi:hypothetical protein
LIRDGGLTIPKKKETIMEGISFACSNPSCRKVFANPLKAEVRGSTRTKPYDACPYCLTEIILSNSNSESDDLQDVLKPAAEGSTIVEPQTELNPRKISEIPVKVAGCRHSFGYLSKRAANEQIPDECMTCENIIQCMLKTVTG